MSASFTPRSPRGLRLGHLRRRTPNWVPRRPATRPRRIGGSADRSPHERARAHPDVVLADLGRPPRVTEPRSRPCRVADRSGSRLPRGPQTAATSACITYRPAPTASASSPSRISAAISSTATDTCSGTASALVPSAVLWRFLVTAVPYLVCSGGTPETYHLVGLRPGTATSKFYETRDILSPTARLRLGSAAPHTDPEQLTPARRLWSTVAPPRRPGTGPAPYERTVRHLIQSSRIAAPRISQGELAAGAVRRPRTRFHQVSPTAGSLRRVVTPSSSASNATGCGSLLAQWISPPTPAAIRQRPCQSMTPTALVRSGQVRIVRRVRCRRGRAAVAAAAVVGAAGRSSKSRVRPPSGSKPSRGSRPSPCPQAWRVDPGRVISCEEACEIVESVQNLPRTDEDR